MNVLVFSTDKTILYDQSSTRDRMIDYGSVVRELHIVIYTSAEDGYKSGLESQYQIGRNVFAHPTASTKKHLFFRDAFFIGEKILENNGSEGKEAEKAADVKKDRRKSNLVVRSIFGTSKKVDLNVLRADREQSDWLISTQDPFETGLVGYKLKKKYKLPLQIQVHTDFLSKHFWKESLKNKIRVLSAEKLLKKADCVRVVSQRIKRSLEKAKLVRKDVPVSILPIHIDTSSVKNAAPVFADIKQSEKKEVATNLHDKYPDYDFVILMASRLTREKNISMAIQAMKKIVKEHPRTLLVVVGDGPEKEKLEAMSKDLSDNIAFRSWAENLEAYYKSADLFLLTSNYEGYGRSVIEAQAYGVPVIMTDVGCAGEAIRDGEGGLVVPVGNVNMLTRRILEVIENDEVRENMSRAARSIKDRLLGKEQYLEDQRQAWFSCRQQ